MRVLIWIVEETWKAPVAAAAALLPADADLTILHVRASEADMVVRGARLGLLGRPHRQAEVSLDTITEESTRELLAEAQAALSRDASLDARAGRTEHEVVKAADGMDLLILARDSDAAHTGPRSIGPTIRHVIEHVQCAVLLVWPV